MRILIIEDDLTSSRLLTAYLSPMAICETARDGEEAVRAVSKSLEEGFVYDLICLDIMMPRMDGQEVLHKIRRLEETWGILPGKGSRIIMTTALSDPKNVLRSFNEQCEAYLVKPIEKRKLLEEMRKLELIQ